MEDYNFGLNHLTSQEKVGVFKLELLQKLTREMIPVGEVREQDIKECLNLVVSLVNTYEEVSTTDIRSKVFNISTPEHYKGKQDVIAFSKENMDENQFSQVMMFNMLKYTTRLGKKDDKVKELEKIYHYLYQLASVKYGEEWFKEQTKNELENNKGEY